MPVVLVFYPCCGSEESPACSDSDLFLTWPSLVFKGGKERGWAFNASVDL